MASSTDFSEKLAEAVRIYPCLYDKASPDFKDNKKKNLAWQDAARCLSPGKMSMSSSAILQLQLAPFSRDQSLKPNVPAYVAFLMLMSQV